MGARWTERLQRSHEEPVCPGVQRAVCFQDGGDWGGQQFQQGESESEFCIRRPLFFCGEGIVGIKSSHKDRGLSHQRCLPPFNLSCLLPLSSHPGPAAQVLRFSSLYLPSTRRSHHGLHPRRYPVASAILVPLPLSPCPFRPQLKGHTLGRLSIPPKQASQCRDSVLVTSVSPGPARCMAEGHTVPAVAVSGPLLSLS